MEDLVIPTIKGLTGSAAQWHEQRCRNMARIRRIVIDAGLDGIVAVDVAKAVGLSASGARGILRELGREGLIECTHPRGGPANRWGAMGIRKRFETEHRAAIEEARKRRKRREWHASQAKAGDAAYSAFCAPVVKRIVPASMCKPIVGAGPRWVFDLGQA